MPKRIDFTNEQEGAMVELYENTITSMEKIGKRFGCSREAIKRVLREHNVKIYYPWGLKQGWKGREHPRGMLGKKMTSEHKAKIVGTGRKHKEESKLKTSESLRGRPLSEERIEKITMRTREAMKNPEIIKKIKKYRATQVFPLKDTSIEVKVQNYLKELGIEFFTHQYIRIEHAYQCDIFIPSQNLIIECDGDAFHFNPKMYKKDDKIFKTGMTAEERWNLDSARTNELIRKGYRVIRLWEHEIRAMGLEEFRNKLEVIQ